ncbi:hypothetical protein Pyrfu_0069 [Pyrolobus fumarii 1A]|uniref:Uncharacterized protein n=1 Tax=Pyrolobus fumarii (strain DSM 11204 / 1A) TaxID=694429 RepID=G0EE25_PYRF1|nr:hypothetical protein Pyrfu_0069 [Pyrolobus fumarii 1A]
MYMILGESRGYLESLLQNLLCSVFDGAGVDAIALVKTCVFDRAAEDLNALRRVAHGGLVTSYTLGAIMITSCDDVDEDAAKLGSIDTFTVSEEGLRCNLIMPHALARCIPRGYTALIAPRYRWEAKLLIAALAHAGYHRIHVVGEQVDANLVGLTSLYNIDVNVQTIDVAHHYYDIVDVVIDTNVLRRHSPPPREKLIEFRLDEPNKTLPCILAHWVSRALLNWESVFVDSARVQALALSLVGNRE